MPFACTILNCTNTLGVGIAIYDLHVVHVGIFKWGLACACTIRGESTHIRLKYLASMNTYFFLCTCHLHIIIANYGHFHTLRWESEQADGMFVFDDAELVAFSHHFNVDWPT